MNEEKLYGDGRDTQIKLFEKTAASHHQTNPWVIAWWSASFPGFGHIMTGSYVMGYLFVLWEFFINVHANLNLAIIYSFTGQFQRAADVLDKRWILLYPVIYIFAVWDSYRLSVQMNRSIVIAALDAAPDNHDLAVRMHLDKRNPWVAAVWSAHIPGMGHLYNRRLFKGFFTLICWIVTVYLSNFLTAVHYTSLGYFIEAAAATDPGWLLFLPSFYGGAIYSAYVDTVEDNKRFEKEQARYLKAHYQHPEFIMPLSY